MVNDTKTHQSSTAVPFLTYVVVCILFILIHSITSFIQFPVTYPYILIGPLLIVYMKQIETPFMAYPFFGFIAMALIQMMIHTNIRYVLGAGLLGAFVWSLAFLFSSILIRNLTPYTPRKSFYIPSKKIKTTIKDESEVSMSDLLMDRAHIGYYLSLDTVLGPGLSTRRGYTTMGGGADCAAPPQTMMTFPDFLPQIPCKPVVQDTTL